jgi:hypothetical protein
MVAILLPLRLMAIGDNPQQSRALAHGMADSVPRVCRWMANASPCDGLRDGRRTARARLRARARGHPFTPGGMGGGARLSPEIYAFKSGYNF